MPEGLECRGVVAEGVIERSVSLDLASHVVPAVVWTPADRAWPPVVLLGHGGSGSKRAARIERLARWFAREAGLAAVAIDGPYHGDRLARPLSAAEYQQRMVEEGVEAVTGRMVRDWMGVLSALGDEEVVDASRVGYLGLSLGTRFGIPLAAALGARLRCAVFGKFGLRQAPAMHPGLQVPGMVAEAARRVTAPVLMQVQWDDELFPREGQFELFDAFGSTEKVLIGRPGGHGDSHIEDEARWRTFVAGRLSQTDSD